MSWNDGPQQPGWQPRPGNGPGGTPPGGWQPPTSGPPSQGPTSGGPWQPTSGGPWQQPTSGQPGWQPPAGPPYGAPPGVPPVPSRGNGPLIGALVAAGVVLVLLVGAGLVWAFGTGPEEQPKLDDKPADTAACGKKLAFFGTLSGRFGPLGVSARNGAKLAVDEFRKKNPDCDVELVEFDTRNDPKTAGQLAVQMAKDSSIIGAVGPVYTVEAPATAPILDRAGLPTISPSASGTDLTDRGWETFHRVIGTDASQGPAAARYLEQLGVRRVAVVADTNPYFRDITKGVRDALGSNALKTMSFDGGKPDFKDIIKYVKKSVIHAVYFSGYADDAEEFLKELRSAKLTVRVLAPDTAYDSDIIDTADRLKHFAVSCTCAAPDNVNENFRGAYERAYGKRAGNYAAEAYDAATVFLKGIADDQGTREDMLRHVKKYRGHGITKKIEFTTEGEIDPRAPVWFYTVENGRFTYDRRID